MKLLIFLALIVLAQADLSKFWPNEGSLKGFPEFAPRIVGGSKAEDGQFPYQVAIKGADGLFCGGAIIDLKNIVTAASCVDGLTTVQVVAGKLSVHYENGVTATQFTVHPDYQTNRYKRQSDIALIHLTTALIQSDSIKPIKINTLSYIEGYEDGIISGWGRYSDSSNALSTVLLYTSDGIIANWACERFFSDMLKDENICLYGEAFKSSCTGDIGGPLVIEYDGETLLVGIASFGSSWGCKTGSPFVYTRAKTYEAWITQNLRA